MLRSVKRYKKYRKLKKFYVFSVYIGNQLIHIGVGSANLQDLKTIPFSYRDTTLHIVVGAEGLSKNNAIEFGRAAVSDINAMMKNKNEIWTVPYPIRKSVELIQALAEGKIGVDRAKKPDLKLVKEEGVGQV